MTATGSRTDPLAGIPVEAVTALVEEVARTVVRPRFRDLARGDVSEKGPGDLVTVVDVAAEVALAEGLTRLTPGVPVVGEEAVAADPALLDVVADADRVWVLDPIDGTQAFVDGAPDYAVMVALVAGGESVAGWICLPEQGRTYVAVRGGGTWLDGRRLTAADADLHALRGAAATKFLPRGPAELPDGVLARVEAGIAALGPGAATSDRLWSGAAYGRILAGEADFAFYWRTNPWDHAAGAVLVREAGGVSRRPDGSDYRPGDDGVGLVVASSAEVADAVVAALRPVLPAGEEPAAR
ncbi:MULTISPECIES: inositol monophosphatase family protein [unclassified Actinotalea]|uniref:inositol monophosphatase family protein n=1 Tax=unclassified Actinotalea TaxID=2638618 RepID=UPI0015F6F6EA|nr:MULTISPECIES: inositol monophosphatase family protein [unclassified Actinotalea]